MFKNNKISNPIGSELLYRTDGMKKIIIAGLALILMLNATPALAAECTSVPWIEQATNIKDGLIIPCECLGDQDADINSANGCNLNSVFQTIVNISQVLLALTGSAALLMFVYGGAMMVIAGTANDDKKNINKGKDTIKAAIVGIAIILGSWMIVNLSIIAITNGDVSSPAKIFNRPFNQAPSGGESGGSDTENTPQPSPGGPRGQNILVPF